MKSTSQSAKDYTKNIVAGTGGVQDFAKSQQTAITGMKAVSIGSKAAAVGVSLLNAAVTMGIGLLIQFAVQGVMKLVNSQQEAIETANQLTQTYQDQTKEIKSNIDTVGGLEKEFNTLSKGVDDYGNNISLTSEEYKRYKDIVEQVVGISPSLIAGYDKEGNAIANKNGLIEQSIALLKEENRQKVEGMVADLPDIGKGKVGEYRQVEKELNALKSSLFGTMKEITGTGFWGTPKREKIDFIADVLGIDEVGDITSFTSRNSKLILENIDKIYAEIEKRTDIFTDQDIGALEKYISKRNSLIKELDNASKALNPTLQIVPQTLTAYDTMSDAQKNFIAGYINGFKITANTTEQDLLVMKQNIKEFVDSIADNEEAQNAINKLFSLDKATLSAIDYKTQAEALIAQIANTLKLSAEQVEDLKITLGIEFVTNDMRSLLKEKFGEMADDIEKSFSIEDIKIILNPKFEFGGDGLDALKEGIKGFKIETESIEKATLAFDDLMKNLDKLQGMREKLDKGTNIDYKDIDWLISNYPDLLCYIGDEKKLRENLINKIKEEDSNAQVLYKNKLWQSSEYVKAHYENNKSLYNSLGIIYNNDTKQFEATNKTKVALADGTVREIKGVFDVYVSQLNGTYNTDLANFVSINNLKAADAQRAAAIAQDAWNRVYQAQTDAAILGASFMSSGNKDNTIYKGDDGKWYYHKVNEAGQAGDYEITNQSIIGAINSRNSIKMPATYNPPKGGGGGSKKTPSAPDKPVFDTFTPSELKTNNDYNDFLDEFLEYIEDSIEKFDTEYSRLNDKLELAKLRGDDALVETLTADILRNRQERQDILSESAITLRGVLEKDIVPVLSGYAGLSSKSPDEWTSIDLEEVRLRLEQAVLDAENAKTLAEDANKRAILNHKNAWEQQRYNILSANNNDQNTEEFKNAKEAYEQTLKNLESATTSGTGIDTAKLELDKFESLLKTYSDYVKQVGFKEGEGSLSDQWLEDEKAILTIQKELRDAQIDAFKEGLEDRMDLAQKYIDDRNFYNDWGADSEIKAWGRVLKYLEDEYLPKAIALEDEASIELAKGFLEEANRNLVSAQRERAEKFHEASIALINEEKSRLEKLRDAETKYWDERISKLRESNDEQERAIQLAELEEKLANQRREKVKRVWSESARDWVYTVDKQAIKETQKQISDMQKEDQIRALEKQRDKELKKWDEQIKDIEKIQERWDSIIKDTEKQKQEALLKSILGDGVGDILDVNSLDALKKYALDYHNAQNPNDKIAGGPQKPPLNTNYEPIKPLLDISTLVASSIASIIPSPLALAGMPGFLNMIKNKPVSSSNDINIYGDISLPNVQEPRQFISELKNAVTMRSGGGFRVNR